MALPNLMLDDLHRIAHTPPPWRKIDACDGANHHGEFAEFIRTSIRICSGSMEMPDRSELLDIATSFRVIDMRSRVVRIGTGDSIGAKAGRRKPAPSTRKCNGDASSGTRQDRFSGRCGRDGIAGRMRWPASHGPCGARSGRQPPGAAALSVSARRLNRHRQPGPPPTHARCRRHARRRSG